MCSRDQSLATVAFLSEKLSQTQCYKDLTRKTGFFRCDLGSSSIIWDGTSYKLEFLHQCDKKIKTKSQKVLVANSYVCRSYRGKAGSKTPHPLILNRVKTNLPHKCSFLQIF